MTRPARYVTAEDEAARHPVHVVWELTLACDLKCVHCGSRAGRKRRDELTATECLALVSALARLGARHVTLIGGEAYLRKDWLDIVRAIRAEGIGCTLQSGALHLTEARIDAAIDAGLQGLGVSIDGMRDLHDRLRGVQGSFDAAFAALRHARARGLPISVNTQITAPVIGELRDLFEHLVSTGVTEWQVQLTVAMGRAADSPNILLQPYQLATLMPLLAELYEEGLARELLLQPGNNIGYYGPFESLFRAAGDEDVHWRGCSAGLTGIGIEADGTIKGCPSLPTAAYAGGNVRDTPLEEIWRSAAQLRMTWEGAATASWGFCGTCYYSSVCRAGCTWTSHSLLGRPGNNPYCHHRVIELGRRGLRERVVQVEAAPGASFDHGRFELVLESVDESGRSDTPSASVEQLVPLRTRSRPTSTTQALELCRGCRRHVCEGTRVCPHCGGDSAALGVAYRARLASARRALTALRHAMKRARMRRRLRKVAS